MRALGYKDRVFNKKLITLTAPIALQSLMLALVAAADAFMLGGIEQNAMSAVSLATQIQFIQNIFLMAAVSATTLFGAQYWGKGDKRSLNDLFILSLTYAGIISILFFIGCVFFPRYLMLIFTNEEVLIEIGMGYLKIAGWSYLLTGFSQCYLAMMKVSEHASMTAKISSGAVIINIVLNAVLIYGFFGLPAFGVKGAAIATLTARVIELLWCLAVSFKKDYLKPHLVKGIIMNKLLILDYYKALAPLLGAGLFWGVGFTAYSAFMGHLGTDATAANSIAAVIRDLVCCFCNGIAGGGGILVGNELGAGKLDKAKVYGDRLVVIAFICGFASTILMVIFTPVLLQFVKLTAQAKTYLISMMLIMAFYMIGRAVNTILINGIFTAGGDTLFDMYSLAVSMWCIAIPLAVAGTFFLHWPVPIVYACTCIDEVGKIPWVIYHYKKYKWVKDLTR